MNRRHIPISDAPHVPTVRTGVPKGVGKSDLSGPSQLLSSGILAPFTFLDAPGVRVGTLPHTDGETEAQVPNGESGVFFYPSICSVGRSHQASFYKSSSFPEALAAVMGHPYPAGDGRVLVTTRKVSSLSASQPGSLLPWMGLVACPLQPSSCPVLAP